MKPSFTRRVMAEFAGTLFLLAAVVGSGIMGERLARKHCHCAPGQQHRYRGGFGRDHHCLWSHFRGAP
jgi:hypothetical protein